MNRIAPFLLLVIAPALAIGLALLGLETLRDNMLGWILLCHGVASTGGIVIDYHVRRGRYRSLAAGGRHGAEERSDLSFWLLLPGFLTTFFAPPLEWMYLLPALPRAVAWQVGGVALFLAGLAVVVWARLSLSSARSTRLAVVDGRSLIDAGPYHIVRHPAFGGLLLMGLGVAIGYSSAIGLAAVAVLVLPALAYRFWVDERLLAALYGEVYAAYARRTRRIVPGLW